MLKRLYPKGNKNGFLLIYVVLIITCLVIIGSAALVYSKNRAQNSAQQNDSMQAYYVADAGIVKAKYIIESNLSDYMNGYENNELISQQDYKIGNKYGKIKSVKLTGPVNGLYTLTSEGVYKNFSKTIKVTLKKIGAAGVDGGGETARFDKGLWVDSLTTGSDTIINSTIYCNGSITAGSRLTIGQADGPKDVHLDGNFTLGSGCVLYGNVFGRGNVTLGSGQCISDSVKALGNITTGSSNSIDQVLAHGSITMGSTAGGIKKIQSNSTINLSSSATVDQEIKAQQSIVFASSCKVHGPVWTREDLTAGSNCTIDGTLYVNGTYTRGSGTTPTTKESFDIDLLPPLDLTSELTDVPSREAIDLDSYKSQAQAAGAGHYFSSGQVSFNLGACNNGVYYINGGITNFNSNNIVFDGNAVIVASGGITLPANQTVSLQDSDNSLVFISGSSIVGGSGNNLTAFLWANNSVNFGADSTLNGGVIAQTFVTGSRLRFNQANIGGGGGSGLELQEWQ